MKVEFRLKKILEKHQLYYHGVAGDLAQYCKVNRQTIGRLMRNQVNCVPLDLLGQISDWLQKEKKIRELELPQALLGPQPAQLWEAITQSRRAIICLGQFEHLASPSPAWRYIARCDAYVEGQIVKFLSQTYPVLQLETRYVPFRVGPDRDRLTMTKELGEDVLAAEQMFREVEAQRQQAAVVSIGSQITNYVTEWAVAQLFGCDAFVPSKPCGSRVPFYVRYRDTDRAVRSCFGGLGLPSGVRGDKTCGIYYRDGTGAWCPLPWVRDEADAGVVITVYDPSHSVQPQLLILGYSGVATETIGAYVASDHASEFWPPVSESRGTQVGVYLCRIRFRQGEPPPGSMIPPEAEVQVIPMDAEILDQCLR